MKLYTILLLLILPFSMWAQNDFPNSRFLEEGQESPPAKLNDIAWLAGHWQGEAFGGITEELWTPPLGGSMMGSFKLVANNQVSFYELMSISEENNSLIMRLKHFDWELKGWEEKDETVDFKLVEATPNHFFFDGLSIQKISKDEIKIFVVIEHEGHKNEVEFAYKRKR
jgi:hypothetical protein